MPLADHEVDLARAGDEFGAFTDLYGYLRRNAVPDRRTASEAQIMARVGAWVGRKVLGERIGEAIIAAAPVTVRVIVSPAAGFVTDWPLELAHSGGVPLAGRGDVTFAYDLFAAAAAADRGREPARLRALRMLAVFSLPTQNSVLALRRERYKLAEVVRQIALLHERQVELTVAQYGVTRQRLAEIAEARDGWDVLHLSGHDSRGHFLLERLDGTPDPVDSSELLDLLRPLRGRVRLAVVSADESATATTAQTMRLVGLFEQAEQLEEQDPDIQSGSASPALTGLARALVEQLGCAAVAMRYPVPDEFAIAFTGNCTTGCLAAVKNWVQRWLERYRERLGEASPTRPAMCLAAPVLVGPGAADLALQAPGGTPIPDPAVARMSHFPIEPERFVGRAQTMAKAGAVLAPGSGRAGGAAVRNGRGRVRPRARSSWPTGTRTLFQQRHSGRLRSRTTRSTGRWRALPQRWRSSSATTDSRWPVTSPRSKRYFGSPLG